MSKARSLSKIANDTPTGIANELAPLRDWRSKNALINGNFDIWQRGTSFTSVGNNQYTADRFQWEQSPISTAIIDIFRSTDVPPQAQAGVTANYSFHVDVTSTDTDVSASEYAFIEYSLEGYDYTHVKDNTFTLSFWVKATKPGIYCVSFRNNNSTRSYIVEYTIDNIDTWEYKTITVTFNYIGDDNFTNLKGLGILWTLAVGSNFQTTPNAWQTGNFVGSANQVNALDSTANNFRLSLIQFEPGTVATSFENKPFGTELALCQRYFEKTMDVNTVPANGVAGGANGGMTMTVSALTFSAGALWKFAVSKRTNPSIVTYGYGGATSNTWRDIDNTANGPTITAINGGTEGVILTASSTTWPRADAAFVAHATAEAEL